MRRRLRSRPQLCIAEICTHTRRHTDTNKDTYSDIDTDTKRHNPSHPTPAPTPQTYTHTHIRNPHHTPGEKMLWCGPSAMLCVCNMIELVHAQLAHKHAPYTPPHIRNPHHTPGEKMPWCGPSAMLCVCNMIELVRAQSAHKHAARQLSGMPLGLCYVAVLNSQASFRSIMRR